MFISPDFWENKVNTPQKLVIELLYDPEVTFHSVYSVGPKLHAEKKRHFPTFDYCSTIYNS